MGAVAMKPIHSSRFYLAFLISAHQILTFSILSMSIFLNGYDHRLHFGNQHLALWLPHQKAAIIGAVDGRLFCCVLRAAGSILSDRLH
jgi:hypothetical protein